MKRIICVAAIIFLFTLPGCSKAPDNQVINQENPYRLSNGYTPTEMISEVESFITRVYIPYSQDDIDKALRDFTKIATESEIEELKSTVGSFDKDKRASISDLQIDMCTPDNSSTRQYKIVATFKVTLKNVSQNLLIEFGMNNDCKINSHYIWINNS